MCCDEKVISTEVLRTVLALEWKEVDEETRRLGALLADGQELGIVFSAGVGRHGGSKDTGAESGRRGL